MILVSDSLLQRRCHSAQFFESLCDTVADLLLVWRVARRQEATPPGQLFVVGVLNLFYRWEVWAIRHQNLRTQISSDRPAPLLGNRQGSNNLAPRHVVARSNFHHPLARGSMSRRASTIGRRVPERCILCLE